MSKISGKETKPELIIRKFLFSQGFRYRKNDKRYPGKPDVILPRYKTAIFIHGCFWHGHNCKAGKLPETNKEVWQKKIVDNKIRDTKNKLILEAEGWKVIVIWGCDLSSKTKINKRLNLLAKEIVN